MHCKSLWTKASAKCINVNGSIYCPSKRGGPISNAGCSLATAECVDPSKLRLLAQIVCPSKGQSSAAILRPETLLCLHVNKRYIIENAEELIASSANLK